MAQRCHLKVMRVLAISGSLRAQSTNTSLLRALAAISAPLLKIAIWDELVYIPPFNPDLDRSPAHAAVDGFRTAIRNADAVIFSTPEYAHGMPGSLKNLLDWIVGSGELSKKPVALINASARGVFAQAALKEVLQTMDAIVLHDAETTIDLGGQKLTATEIAGDPRFAALLSSFAEKLANHA